MQTNFLSTYQTIVKAPVEKVWDALTNPAIVKQYFFGTKLETDWKIGSPIYFKGEWEGKPYEDKGVVQEFVPNHSLAYTYLSNWSGLPDNPNNYLLIRYEVKQVVDSTELKIIQSNYDEEKAKHSAGNWALVIDGLKKLVE